MLVDGKSIAADIYREIKNELSHLNGVPHLTIFTCAPSFATKKYLEMKRKRAAECGVEVNVVEIPEDGTTEDFVQSVERMSMQTDGVVVQLPLPVHINADVVLAAIPAKLDVDAVAYQGGPTEVLPPVVGAIVEIARRHDVMFAGQDIVIVGEGRLVGAPARAWATQYGWQVHVVTEITPHPEKFFRAADILILGAGQPGLITDEHIKEGVVIFDAATSEQNSRLTGDALPECAKKASLTTPVPGGIGPITVAVLLKNLVLRYKQNR